MRPLRLVAVAALTAACAPALAQLKAPEAIEAIAFSQNEIRVYWDPVPHAAKYVITRDGATIGEAAASATEYTDSTAEAGRTYRYNVAAEDSSGALSAGRPYVERAYDALPDRTRCDVLVVGATTGGVSAAVTAARYGLSTILIEETRRLGGMPVNGLGATDMRRPEHSSGFFEEFRRKIVELYGRGDGMNYEPRVAHQAMKEIVWSSPGLIVHRQVRPVKVTTRDGRVTQVVAEFVPTGRRVAFEPKLVVDATDTGDVAAWAGAPFRVGREPRSKREPHAGYIFYDRASDSPLPGSTGRGDKRVQAYAYLMVVKDYGPGADRTIPQPPGYDPRKYEHAPKWEQSWAVSSGKLPNHKFEVNQHPQGSDLQVVNYPYPTASYAERRRIEKLYRDHDLGYLYYIQTVEGHKNIGLSDDDYRDSDGWPQLLYIREARRFETDHVLDEYDISHARDLARPDAIGIGDYPMDSHAVEPKTDWSRPDMGEGEFYLPQWTPWHQVPYHAMIPKRVQNLFVPTAVSATHVAYGTLRLEPTRMEFGEATGIACYLCLRYRLAPEQVPSRQIQAELLKHDTPDPGQHAMDGVGAPGPNANPAFLYYFPDVKPGNLKYGFIQWLGARGFYPSPEPAKRTAASGQYAAPFEPDSPMTTEEAARLFALLARRRALEGQSGPSAPRVDSPRQLSRGAAAQMLVELMAWSRETAPPRASRLPTRDSHYADVPPGSLYFAAAEALYANWIDSGLWDFNSFAPDGRMLFRPDAPITRAQFAQMLYLAHIHIGPLFFDHPEDQHAIPVSATNNAADSAPPSQP